MQWDHAQLVSAHWLLAAEARLAVFVKRVKTDDNIADLPSRTVFRILNLLGATFVAPKLEPCFHAAEAWAILQARWAGNGQSQTVEASASDRMSEYEEWLASKVGGTVELIRSANTWAGGWKKGLRFEDFMSSK